VRGSEVYRRTLARNVLLKFWHEAVGNHTDRGNGNGDPDEPLIARPMARATGP
jgi:hypothetical protein